MLPSGIITGMSMRPLAAALIAVLIALPLASQEKLVETIEVRVVNIDVVVTDRAGNPVHGLTKSDFEVFENRKPQTITNLYEVRSDPESLKVAGALEPANATTTSTPNAPPEEMRQRRVALFVDNYSLQVFQRNQILKSLEKFVDKTMRPGDEAALISWDKSLRIVVPFTTDREELKRGIAAMSQRVTTGNLVMSSDQESVKKLCDDYIDMARSRQMGWPLAFDLCKGAVNSFSDQVAANTRNLVESLRLTSTTLAGVEGKKVMVIAGAHLPERPGLELNMWALQRFSQFMRNISSAQALGDTAHNLQTFSIEKFARQANADGVTVYAIDAADQRDYISAETSRPTDQVEQFASFTNTAMAYQTITRITGGAMVSSLNYDAAFQTIARDLSSYYSLGYKPPDSSEKAASDRRLVVKAKNPEYRVRARQTYAPKSTEEAVNDRVISNIYHGSIKSEWPIILSTGMP